MIEDFKPDIIHLHGTESGFADVLPFTSVPYVISIQGVIHSINLKLFAGLSYDYIKKNAKILDYIKQSGPVNTARQFQKLMQSEQKCLRDCRYIIGRTNLDRRVSNILAPNARYFYNAEILRSKFYINMWKPSEHKIINLFTITNKAIYKGLETIFNTLKLLSSAGFNVLWYIAGLNGDERIVKITRKHCAIDRSLSEKLVFLGNCNEDKLILRMLDSDFYIQTSHIENSPNSLCEAQILGMPCIASYAGGTSSFINDGHDGLLYQDGDYFALAGTILELHKNKTLAMKISLNGRQNALERHDPKLIIEDLIKIYMTIHQEQ